MKALLSFLVALPLWGAASDTITLDNTTSGAISNYPLQFARPFVRGEIPDYPQIGVCSDSTCQNVTSWLVTQADVKTRWDNGSVKHAIISVLVPSLPAGKSYFTFTGQPVCNCGISAALSQSGMLDPMYDFDAQIQLTQNSIIKTASARQIISDWDGAPDDQRVTYWVAGSVATTVILADHINKSYDMGWQADQDMPLAANMSASDTQISVTDASGVVIPQGGVNAEVYVPGSKFRANETVHLCSTNTTVTPNLLLIGNATCSTVPAASGRNIEGDTTGTHAFTTAQGARVHPLNAWRDPSDPKYASFRPVFQLTFWPGIARVKVRFVGEQTDSDKLQDQVYDIALSVGSASPATVYTKSQFLQHHATRWTKTYWLAGYVPPVVEIVHNLAYLASSNLMWNWNPSLTPSTSFMDDCYTHMMAGGVDLGQTGGNPGQCYGLNFSQATAGGGSEKGPENTWFVDWLYTGYNRAYIMASTMAELAGGFTIFFREGHPGKHLDRGRNIAGMGHIAAITDRQSTNITTAYNYGNASDQFMPVGPFGHGKFSWDVEHQANYELPLYILTGDYFYLESGWFWANAQCHMLNGAAAGLYYGRGPKDAGDHCTIPGTIRTQAWMLRARLEAAMWTPDGMPEKDYFTELTNDYLAFLEGVNGLPNSQPASADWTMMHKWATTVLNGRTVADWLGYTIAGAVPPMGQFMADENGIVNNTPGAAFVQPDYGIDTTYVSGANSLFETGYMVNVLALARDYGWPVAPLLLQRLGIFYNGAVNNTPVFNPFLLNSGRVPTLKLSGSFMVNWAEMLRGFWPTLAQANQYETAIPRIWQGTASFCLCNADHGYDAISMSSIAQTANYTGGATAWAFAAEQRALFTSMNDIPKWAILPRPGLGGLRPPTHKHVNQ